MRLSRNPQLFEGGLKLRLSPDGAFGTVLGQPPALPGPLPCPAPPGGTDVGRGAAGPVFELDLLMLISCDHGNIAVE